MLCRLRPMMSAALSTCPKLPPPPVGLVQEVSGHLKEAMAVPAIQKLVTDENNKDLVYSTWSQSSVPLGKPLRFLRVHHLGSGSELASEPIPVSEGDLQEVRGDVKVQIVKAKDDQEVMHIFRSGRLVCSHDLSALSLHGPVYFDETFGGIALSASGRRLAYIAEGKKPKNKPFLEEDKGKKEGEEEGKEEEETEFGQEYRFHEEFGEQLVGKGDPVIAVREEEAGDGGKFRVVARETFSRLGLRPGRLAWAGERRLVGAALQIEPRILGAIYCDNRPKRIFVIDLDKDEKDEGFLQFLSAENCSASEPRYHDASETLVWVERDLGQKGFYPGPHLTCNRLMKRRLGDSAAESEVVVPVVGAYNKEFAGLYNPPPRRGFSPCGRFFFISTLLNHTMVIVKADVRDNKFQVLSSFPHLSLTDVHHGVVLAIHSTPASPPRIAVAKLEGEECAISSFSYLEPSKPASLVPGLSFSTFDDLVPSAGHPEPRYAEVGFNAFYVGTEEGEAASRPLIVWPHGGPHGAIATSFMEKFYFFHRCGFSMLLVNFRGSLGRGQDSVESIMGNCGDTDVKDCYQATQECLKRYPHLNPGEVYLFGGSHGGFLVTHLAGQYPDTYHGVMARNPVTNIATMACVTDIPDWCANVSGMSYDYRNFSSSQLCAMRDRSPAAHAHNVKAPVLLLIGKNDLRVPPSQGHEYYHALRALGRAPVAMNVYDDNHPLAKVKNDVNVFAGSAVFMAQCRKWGQEQ